MGDRMERLAGRASEVDGIVEAHAQGRRLVVVCGEDGAGKSAVLDEAVSRAAGRGTHTLVGRCPRISVSALEPFWQAFGPMASEWTTIPTTLHPLRRDVLRVLGPSGAHLGSMPTDPAVPGALAAALTALAGEAGQPERALLVIDDVHFGDADLRVLLGAVARSSAAVCAVVSLTGTSVDASEFVEEIGAPDSVCVALDGLDEAAVRQIVLSRRADASPQMIDELHQRSGGNALFLLTMLDSDTHLSGDDVPASIADGVSRRLAGLPDRERAICEAVAIVGRSCSFELVQRLVDLSESDVVAGLRRLQDLKFIGEGPPDEFWLRSPMMAAVAAATTLSRQRRRLHTTVLEVLEATDHPDPASVLAHAAAIGDARRAVPAARAAAMSALDNGTPGRAARLAVEGLSFDPADVRLLLAAAEAELRCNDCAATERHGLAVTVSPSATPSQRAAAWRVLARARWHVGDGVGRTDALDRAAALLPLVPRGAEWALVHLAQAEAAMVADDLELTLEAVAAARAHLSPAVAEHESLSVALDVIEGSVLASRRDDISTRGISMLERALPVVLGAGDVATAGRTLNNLIHATIYRRPADWTAGLVDQLDTVSTYDERFRPYVRLWRALLAECEGDSTSVAAHARVPALPCDSHDLCVRLVGVHLLLDQHRLVEASAVLTAASAFAASRADPELEWWTTCLSLQHRVLAGEQIATEIVQRLEGRAHPTLIAGDKAGGLAIVTAQHWPGTTPALAAAMSQWLDPVAQVAWTLHLDAMACAAAGDHEAAIAIATASANDPHPRAAANRAGAWIVAARSAAAIGDRARGRAFAHAALSAVAHWPGTTQDEARSVLRSLGGRPTAQRSAGLTPREQDVAKLIAAGLANAEIGRRLGMSARTVGVHVTHILPKIGASNRTEIAIHAVRSGLAE
ncbi:MAG: AAA family ATPase [Actinobacteria bacterium]|nr:AAA family ATPase [Actinomycetota bacterium]